LNRCTGFCRPLPNHSATPPNETPGSPGAQASLPEGRRPPRRPAKSVSSSKVRIHKLTNWPFGLGITHVAKIGPIDDTASPSRDCSGREQRGGCRTWPECCVIGERSTRGSGSTHLPSGATIMGRGCLAACQRRRERLRRLHTRRRVLWTLLQCYEVPKAPGGASTKATLADVRWLHRTDARSRAACVHSGAKRCLHRLVGREELRDLAGGQIRSQLRARLTEQFAVNDGDDRKDRRG
jgi:hypothetical protein